MAWTIRPLEGVGALRFGMSQDDVAAVLGHDYKFTRLIEDGSFNEYRCGSKPVCNFFEKRLRCIDLYSTEAPVILDDISLFEADPQDVVDHLEALGGAPSVRFDACYFREIGISLGKWVSFDDFRPRQRPRPGQDLRSVSVSVRGAHAELFTDEHVISLKSPGR